MPPFDVFKNCLWPKNAGLAIAVSLRAAPPSRERVAALINDLWRQARTTMGKGFPRVCQICAFPTGTTMWSSNWLACAKAGFEPPGEEVIDFGPEVENRTPYSLAEEAARLAQDRAGLFHGRHRLRLTVNQGRREVEILFPYLRPGEDQWARHLTYADAAAPFFSIAGDFYSSSVPEPKNLRFVGIWKGKRMLQVHLTGESSFRSLQQWPMLEQLHRAKLPSHSSARTPEQEATVRSAYEASLGKLPQQRVWVHPLLQAGDLGS